MQLQDFPFDLDSIEVQFSTSSLWQTNDGAKQGSALKGKTYRLRPVNADGREGIFLMVLPDTKEILEWELIGISSCIMENEPYPSGEEETYLHVDFHVARKSSFYFWKALLPLYLLTGLAFSAFFFETDNLSDRNQTVATYFLAAFAMLYVVGEALPKTDFLTKIDKVIVLTTCTLATIGVASCFLYLLHLSGEEGKEQAKWWNVAIGFFLSILFTISNSWIFLPSCFRQMTTIAALKSSYAQVGDASTTKSDADTELPATLKEGFAYMPIDEVPSY